MADETEVPLKEEIRELNKTVKEMLDTQKPKKFRSLKARISTTKLKKGYVAVVEIGENKVVNIRREPIVDGTIKLNDTFHAVTDLEIFLYKPGLGKAYPMVFLPKTRLQAWSPLSTELEKPKETYGQKYVMARMESDRITAKKALGFGAIVIGIAVIGGIAYLIFSGGFS